LATAEPAGLAEQEYSIRSTNLFVAWLVYNR
jgi:hypothetical protein